MKLNLSLYLIFIGLIICSVLSCVPEIKQDLTTVVLDVKTDSFREVLDLSNAEKIDSLTLLLNDSDPTKRYLASRAFCSLQSVLVGDSLLTLLNDPVLDVRMIAARALGQLGNTSKLDGLVQSFKSKDTSDVNNIFNRIVLESVGKLGDAAYLNFIAGTTTYKETDSHLLLGQARAIYQFAQRSIVSELGTQRMIALVLNANIQDDVRLIGANYLARAKNINLEPSKFQLAERLSKEENPHLRLCLAKALSKIKDWEILTYLKNQYAVEEDYRVKLNIIKAYESYNYIDVVDDIFSLVNDKDYRIGLAAAQYLKNQGSPSDALIYKTAVSDTLDDRVAAKLYEAILTQLPHYYTNSRYRLRKEILNEINTSSDTYLKANYIRALAHDPLSYTELQKLYDPKSDFVVNTALAESFKTILANENLELFFKSRTRRVRREIIELYKEWLKDGDAGVLAVLGTSMADPASKIKTLVDSTNWVKAAMDQLKMPRDIESYNELSKAWSYLNDKENPKLAIGAAKEIDWSILGNIGDSTRVVVKTTRGNITFALFPQKAPESVANFVKLANRNFYDQKLFHRVVPNFVIQTGCPRGDGYGGMNYTIHSELADAIYDDEGYIGMASAGRHTEGSQWFITHRPTPHLDFNYTIFGKVTDGMDVVHAIEVGDEIVDVIILN